MRALESDGVSTRLALSDGAEIIVPVAAAQLPAGSNVTLGIRPEDLLLSGGDFRIPFNMELHKQLGPTSYLYGLSGGEKVVAEHRERGRVDPGQATSLGVNAAHVHLFDADGRSVLFSENE